MISVVIPALNSEKYLKAALKSVDAQGCEDLEILVVDDHSSDGTAAIGARHPRTRVLQLEVRTGPSAARNMGIENARGEWVAFLDADDLWVPDKLRVQMGRAAAQPELQAIYGRVRPVVCEGAVVPQFLNFGLDGAAPLYALGSAIYRRSFLAKLGPLDETLRFGEDLDYVLRALESGAPMLRLRDVLLDYRIHGKNMTYYFTVEQAGYQAVILKSLIRRRKNGLAALRNWDSVDEMAKPSISVVIPAYNAEKTLRRAIDSVLEQSLAAMEVIVVDDGSRDGTAEVAREYGERVRVVQQENSGGGAARNRGVLEARGNQIAFLDADDLWLPGKLAVQWSAISAEPYPELVFGLVEQVRDETGEVLGQQAGLTVVSLMATRGAIDRAGPFRSDVYAGEFLDWYLRAQDLGLRVATVGEVVAQRRQRAGSVMGSRPDATRDYLRILKESLDRRRK